MEPTIQRFVLTHARKETLWVILLTLLSLPIYYLSLDIPKNIMNQAIVGRGMNWPTTVWGFGMTRVEFLFFLCSMFLLAVLVNGGLKQYINTLKGRLGERLLRRLRYELVSRVLRFPLPHFRKVSAAEIIPMVTAEVEPIGGYMGDAFAQPLIQLGTLLTIVVFLFIQNPVMGLAAISLYPLQAYLIPRLQKRVNQLGKERVKAVRRVSERIGESVAGIQEIRAHGTAAYERAHYGDMFGRIFDIRFEIYQRKGFVKFLNNFLNQLAPLLFYSIGGYLVIHGELTVGALTAALTANKDMTAPWKELLDWYQQTQDAKIKYEQVTEQFRPENMVDEALQAPLDAPSSLAPAPISAIGVSVVDESGTRLLESASVTLAPGERVAVIGPPAGGKDVFAQLLARLAIPSGGRITWGDQDLARFGEATLGARVSYVGSSAYVFSTSVRENLLYGLKQRPVTPAQRDPERERARQRWLAESRRAGNSDLDSEASWVDIAAAGAEEPRALDARLLALLAAVDLIDDIYNLGLRGRIDPARSPERAALILTARTAVAERLRTPELKALVEPFDPERYNTNATVAENLLFGTPTRPEFEVDALATNSAVTAVLDRTELTGRLIAAGRQVAATMVEIFADLPAGHELFEQYSFLSAEELAELPALLGRVGGDGTGGTPADRARLLSLPLKLIDARHRLGVIDEDLKARILEARKALRIEVKQGVAFFDADRYNAAATILDNILFGKIAYGQARADARVGKVIAETLDERGLRGGVLEVGLDYQVGVAGARLSAAQRQKLALARGLAKRPALMVVNEATASLDAGTQARIMDGVLREIGSGSLVWVLHAETGIAKFDRVIGFAEGRIARIGTPAEFTEKPLKAAD
ncbi:MAG: ABC transporter ATP-binding protein [Alphaproteobacteria bacterium]|nr:ABC transporter ATP-binding protein [Alphaproteobacteria bacterium]